MNFETFKKTAFCNPKNFTPEDLEILIKTAADRGQNVYTMCAIVHAAHLEVVDGLHEIKHNTQNPIEPFLMELTRDIVERDFWENLILRYDEYSWRHAEKTALHALRLQRIAMRKKTHEALRNA